MGILVYNGALGKYDNAKPALRDLLKFVKVNDHSLNDLFSVLYGSIQDREDLTTKIDIKCNLNKKQIKELKNLPYRYVYFSNHGDYRRIDDKNLYNVMNRIVWSMLIGYGETTF